MKLYNFNKTEGFFVEAGAYDGVTASNTLLMETRYGWSGDDDCGQQPPILQSQYKKGAELGYSFYLLDKVLLAIGTLRINST